MASARYPAGMRPLGIAADGGSLFGGFANSKRYELPEISFTAVSPGSRPAATILLPPLMETASACASAG